MENINKDIEDIKINKNKSSKRIGTFTFGLTLILFGLIVIIQTFAPFDLLRYVLMLWPIVFISIGAETLYYLFKKDIQIKYDFLGILLTLFLVFIGAIFSIGNYAVNKILYDEKVQDSIIQIANNSTYNISYDNNCIITNQSQKPVNIKIVEISSSYNMVKLSNNISNDSNASDNFILQLISSGNKYSHIYATYSNDDKIIVIQQSPDYITSVDIIIYTNDKNNIKLENCTIIE